MHLKTAVHLLTSQRHRLAWRTDQALRLLEQWRARQITTEVYYHSIDELIAVNPEDLAADELADLDLYCRTLTAIKNQRCT